MTNNRMPLPNFARLEQDFANFTAVAYQMPLTFQHTDHVSGELHDVFQSRYKAYGVEQIRVKIGVVKERRIIKKDHLGRPTGVIQLIYAIPHDMSCWGHISLLSDSWNNNHVFHVTLSRRNPHKSLPGVFVVLSECSSYYSMQHGHHPSSTSVIELEI